MSDFQNMLSNDITAVFLNPEEFGEEHRINGKLVVCVLDTDARVELSGGEKLGLAGSSLRLFAASKDIAPRKDVGGSFNLDSRIYTVEAWDERNGMAEVTLSQARSY